MDHFAGLDVSVKQTSICIVDDTGRIVREAKVTSEPEALLAVLKNLAFHFKRIGLEAGPLSQWLYSALAEAGLPVICVETRHMRAVLKAQINKTDRNDARGIAQMMRVGLYRPVHVKTLRSQKLRMLLTHRKLLQSKAIAIDNDLRGTLRNFGLKVGMVGTVRFEARIRLRALHPWPGRTGSAPCLSPRGRCLLPGSLRRRRYRRRCPRPYSFSNLRSFIRPRRICSRFVPLFAFIFVILRIGISWPNQAT
jgi:transposase